MPVDYKDAGVNVESGYEAVRLMKQHVARTMNPQVLGGLGSFGGCYALPEGVEQPVLVAGTDGVGTKLKVAFALNKHDTVGIDCVAMCVNDIVCQGAKPLFFLDYIANGKLDPIRVADIVKGVSEGCVQAGCALIGGETAEMPGFYLDDEYDLAGFSVGLAARDQVITGERVQAGDALIGLHSTGVHSNGFSLIRKLIPESEWMNVQPELGATWGETLLTPTRIYVSAVLELKDRFDLHGVAHITGGGFIENIPRILPQGTKARIKRGSWPVPAVFSLLQVRAECDEHVMYNTFNMGVGMVWAIPAQQAQDAVAALAALGYAASVIGSVESSDTTGVELCEA